MGNREEITKLIRDYLNELEWEFECTQEGEVYFDTGVGLENNEAGAAIYIVVGKRAYTVMVAPVFEEFSEEQGEDIKDFITAVNAKMLLGTLVFNAPESILYVQVSQMCSGQLPDHETLEDSLMLPITIADDLVPALRMMLEGRISPEEAAMRFLTADAE